MTDTGAHYCYLIYLSIYLSINQSIYLSIYLIYLSIYLSICQSMDLWIYQYRRQMLALIVTEPVEAQDKLSSSRRFNDTVAKLAVQTGGHLPPCQVG